MNNKLNILITGSEGVVGSKLREVLKERGHTVFGCDLHHTDHLYGHRLGAIDEDNYFRCDISEYRQISELIDYVKPDLVYNCGAEFGRWNGESFYEKVWKTNAVGTKNIIRLQERDRFKLVHTSSSEVYGNYEGIMYEDVTNEVPIVQMNDYAMSKRVNEMQIMNSKIMYDTETVVVRLFNTYGPREWYHPFRSVNCIFTYKLLHGFPIVVYKGHGRTSTYIDDCVRTLANISDNFQAGQTYNIASDQHHSIEYLVECILNETQAPKDLVVCKEHPEILTTKDKKVDASKAQKELGHVDKVSLEEGVNLTVKWMREYYKP